MGDDILNAEAYAAHEHDCSLALGDEFAAEARNNEALDTSQASPI